MPGMQRAKLTIVMAVAMGVGCNQGSGTVYCGDEKTMTSPITGGTTTWDSTIVPLTDAQARAVGCLELGGAAMCTGTLVTPTVVLTAAHCLDHDWSYINFRTGTDCMAPDRTYSATAWHMHPLWPDRHYDIAVVELATSPTTDGVEPIPAYLGPPMLEITGEQVVAVGYGETSPGSGNTARMWTVFFVDAVDMSSIQASSHGAAAVCDGDSGGPLLWNHPDRGPVVVGELRNCDTFCAGNAYYARTDGRAEPFLATYIPADPCDGETLAGRCDGNTAIYCEGGAVHSDVCVSGEECGEDGEGRYRCLPVAGCGAETWTGRCTGDGVAIWCQDDAILSSICPDLGLVCGLDGEGNYRCVTPGPCETAGLDYAGTCTGDGHAQWCEDDVIKDRDCVLCNQVCGWVSDVVGYYCI